MEKDLKEDFILLKVKEFLFLIVLAVFGLIGCAVKLFDVIYFFIHKHK
jgi:hypothetical protein